MGRRLLALADEALIVPALALGLDSASTRDNIEA
jgi:hypothetical protein